VAIEKRTEGRSFPAEDTDGFIPPHGGYQHLLCYQKNPIVVYDATVHFFDRFVNRKSRTYDRMIQAARSGKQNILEGSEASGASKEVEIKLTGVAKARLRMLVNQATGRNPLTQPLPAQPPRGR
jgi:hypothetical protein